MADNPKPKKEAKPLDGAAVHLSHLKAQKKRLEHKLEHQIPKLADDMQPQSRALTEQRLADVNKQIAKLSK